MLHVSKAMMPSNNSNCCPPSRQQRRTGAAWLEIFLALAFLVLFFQVFPSFWKLLWQAFDVREWSRMAWISLNVVVLVALFGVRFIPEALTHLRERRQRLPSRRKERFAETAASAVDEDLEARRRRDAEWAQRAKKRLPWQ